VVVVVVAIVLYDCVFYVIIRSGTDELQNKVAVVKNQMQYNLDVALKRGDELGNLQTTAGKILFKKKLLVIMCRLHNLIIFVRKY
jgi:hypothetical protein